MESVFAALYCEGTFPLHSLLNKSSPAGKGGRGAILASEERG
jgi:hypothetical protein